MTAPDKSRRREPPGPSRTGENVRRTPRPLPQPKPHVRLISPEGGEHWSWVTEQDITWASYNVSQNVDLELMQSVMGRAGATYQKIGDIATDLPIAKGACSWRVGEYMGPGIPPPRASPCGGYHVRIRTADGVFSDMNKDPFTIDPRPTLLVTTPKGDIWQPENILRISWEAEHFPPGSQVRVDVIRQVSTVIATFPGIPAEQEHFDWDISNTEGIEDWATYHIRVSSMEQFTNFATSFEIEASSAVFSIWGFDLAGFKTLFEGDVPYQKYRGFWVRKYGSAGKDIPQFFRDYKQGFSDPAVQEMIEDMAGGPSPHPATDEEIWQTISLLWDWLIAPGHMVQTSDINILGSITSIPGRWPSVSDWARYYLDHGKTLVWGACNDKISLFANLLIQMNIPQDRFAIASARHNLAGMQPEGSTHFYIALFLNNRWFYIDPLASVKTSEHKPARLPDFMHACSVGYVLYNKNIDYQHPDQTILTPEYTLSPWCTFARLPYLPR